VSWVQFLPFVAVALDVFVWLVKRRKDKNKDVERLFPEVEGTK
jgi:hypothetical protein